MRAGRLSLGYFMKISILKSAAGPWGDVQPGQIRDDLPVKVCRSLIKVGIAQPVRSEPVETTGRKRGGERTSRAKRTR